MRRTHSVYLTSGYDTVAGGTSNPDPVATVHIRSFPTQQQVFDGGGVLRAQTDYEYDNYNQTAPDNFHNVLTDRSGITGLDSAYATTRYSRGQRHQDHSAVAFDGAGNVTTSMSSYAQYDIAGNVVKAVDPRSTANNIIAATFDFSDRFGSPDDEARSNTQAPQELGALHTYALPSLVTNALGQTSYTQFDYYVGKPVNTEDVNGIVSSARYDDALDRPRGVDVGIFPGSQLQRHTAFIYSDSSHLIATQSDQTTLNDGVLTSTILYDGLGRTIETRTSAPEGTIYTTQQYDAMGRVKRSYNPYRTTSDSTYGYTDTTYDALGGVKSVTTSDSAVVMTSYSGNTTTVTDQAGKVRRSVSDGLGRLKQVIEDPFGLAYSTTYGYDALDDLTSVTQGAHTRTFAYDSLKRLTQANNPESLTINYSYDANSNLLTRQDARLITTTYAYNALNRVTKRTYTNDPQNTPPLSYKYDAQSLPTGAPTFARGASIGRLVAVTYGGTSAGTYTGYDHLGLVNVSVQQTDSQNYEFGYGYNLASEMTTETYPSGRVITSGFDTAGRLKGVNGQKTGEPNKSYASQFSYAAHGAVAAMQLGNGERSHEQSNCECERGSITSTATQGADEDTLERDSYPWYSAPRLRCL